MTLKIASKSCIKRKDFKPNISGAGADIAMEIDIAMSLGKNTNNM
jgi:hypothetical protein